MLTTGWVHRVLAVAEEEEDIRPEATEEVDPTCAEEAAMEGGVCQWELWQEDRDHHLQAMVTHIHQ